MRSLSAPSLFAALLAAAPLLAQAAPVPAQPGPVPQKPAVRERGPGARTAEEANASAEAQPRPVPARQRRPVGLIEALGLAAKGSPDVAVARAQAAVARVAVDRYWTSWKPDLSASGTFDHSSASASIPPTPPIFPNGVTLQAANTWLGTLQISQPLFTPQGLFLKAPAEAGAEAAARGADEAREQVLLGVARTWLGIKGVQGLLDAARDAEKVALRREADAKVQINAGTAVEIALLRAQTETAQARAQIANLEGNIESLTALLESLIGEPVSVPPGPSADTELGNGGDEASQPWEQTFAIAAAAAQVKAAQALVRADEFLWLPSLVGIAKGNYNSNGGFAGQNTSYDLILNLSVPLYDRGARYVTKREDEGKLQQAVANLASVRAKARSAWWGAKANLAAAQAVLAQSESQAALAKRAQEQVEVAAKAGVATSLDLSDADNRRFQADSAAAQARASVDVRRAELAAAEGRLFRAVK